MISCSCLEVHQSTTLFVREARSRSIAQDGDRAARPPLEKTRRGATQRLLLPTGTNDQVLHSKVPECSKVCAAPSGGCGEA